MKTDKRNAALSWLRRFEEKKYHTRGDVSKLEEWAFNIFECIKDDIRPECPCMTGRCKH